MEPVERSCLHLPWSVPHTLSDVSPGGLSQVLVLTFGLPSGQISLVFSPMFYFKLHPLQFLPLQPLF